MSQQLRIHAADGEFSCYVARPANAVAAPVVIVIQEIFGVNAGIRSIADSYAEKGYIAIAPDLFWRGEPNLDLSEKSEQDLAKGFAHYNAYDVARGVQDIAATVAAARTLERLRQSRDHWLLPRRLDDVSQHSGHRRRCIRCLLGRRHR